MVTPNHGVKLTSVAEPESAFENFVAEWVAPVVDFADRWWIVLILPTAALFALVLWVGSGFDDLGLELAGTSENAIAVLQGTEDLGRAQWATLLDFLFIPAYALLLAGMCRRGLRFFDSPGARSFGMVVAFSVFIAALLDVGENIFMIRILRSGKVTSEVDPLVTATLSWTKWLIIAVALFYAFASLVTAFSKLKFREMVAPGRTEEAP
jgi:hypothetical protein